MDRPEHIEEILHTFYSGRWWDWSDASDKSYANLILRNPCYVNYELVENPHTMPTEKEVNDRLKEYQDRWDAENAEYVLNRARAYPSIADQLDQIYHEGIDAWKETIAAVKAEYPKP